MEHKANMNILHLHVCIILLISSYSKCNESVLIWQPNNEGLFSQYLQMHIMIHVTKNLNITFLNILDFKTAHFNKYESLCDIFVVPNSVRCVSKLVATNQTTCRETSLIIRQAYYYKNYAQLGQQREKILHRLNLYNNSVCYDMITPFIGGQTRRDAILRSTSFFPTLKFHHEYTKDFRLYLHMLFSNVGSFYATGLNYTVVHWRRGDQLASRCMQGRDTSVNCLSVQELIGEVKRYTTDKVVYIATNDDSLTAEDLQNLRAAGFQLFNASRVSFSASSVSSFVLEVKLMLSATTFLGWGVSIINDIVEHERMRQGLTWCATVEPSVAYPTWCWLQAQRIERAPWTHASANEDQQQKRAILLHEDAKMAEQPLVLSTYNISNMPSYQLEIVDNVNRMNRLFQNP